MTIDTKRLRELAEKALEVESVGLEWYPVESLQLNCDFDIRDAEFIAATGPQTVLALLDEIERLRGALFRILGYTRGAVRRLMPEELAELERERRSDD